MILLHIERNIKNLQLHGVKENVQKGDKEDFSEDARKRI
jgi:hypothetical protein